MRAIAQDLRYALRALLKSRGFTAAAIAVFALGIGANSAIFSVVNTVLLRPLPFADPDRIVKVLHVPPADAFPGMKEFPVSPANYLDWRASNHSFEAMAAYQTAGQTLTRGDRPEIVKTAMTGSDFFTVLGARPEIGRFFSNPDDQTGSAGVAVISDSFWHTRFGADPAVLGRTVNLNEKPYTIIGVAPPQVRFQAWNPAACEIFIPLAWDEQTRAERKNHNYLVVAKLKPGISIAKAQAEMDTISARLAAEYPDADRGWGATVFSLRGDVIGTIRPVLLVLVGAVAFVLLIACANVANLITARNLGRRREMAVRAALGASRARALQQLLCESLLLALSGGALGLVLASAAMPLLLVYVRQQFPISAIPLDGKVLAATLIISVLTGVIAGTFPAWRGSKSDVNDALKQGGRSASDGGARLTRGALVAVEVALSLMLLAGAGLMIRSLWILTGVDPGFDPRNVLTLGVTANTSRAANASDLHPFYERVLETVRAMPGVQAAGLVDSLPLSGGGSVQPFTIEGRPAALFAQQPTVAVRRISPGYLGAMRIRVLAGRDFTDADVLGRTRLVLISESMAKTFWPGENPIGKHLTLSFTPEKPCEVAGIVADVKQDALDAAPSRTLYEAEAQDSFKINPQGGFYYTLAVRTAGRPEDSIAAITNTITRLDPTQVPRDVRPMQAIVDESIADRRMSMLLLSTFAALALVLAGFGLYSVLAYTVRRRVREIGIRVALGASVADILRIVALESLRPTLAGMVAGLAGSLLASSLLSKLIYGVRPTDPATFTAVAFLLALIALTSSIIPAWRATRVDPLQVLRDE